MPKLVISGTAHELVEDLITIGRGPDNTITINDPSVSTHHAQLQLVGETYRLKDLDSANASPFARQKGQKDSFRNGVFVGLGIVLLVFLGSMIAVLMMHAPVL